jgi:hypothetical protein
MRTLSKLAAALVIGFVTPAHAQGAGNTSITVEQPWARATPGGAKTGAVFSSFDKRIGGYTGTPEEIAQIAKEYRVY